jgi:hypothetical protein
LSLIYSGRCISFVFRVIPLANLLQRPAFGRSVPAWFWADRRHRSSKESDKTIASIWFNLIEVALHR